ncbi:hypothetical protein QR680_009507 [Steinernema hermaphroditum]|uniref:Uncharacterized protein n=1 Tax=Steinernema hermaphroditum TaxID=289476 RepID=A0AA39ILX4_9BILA|nr:hypothetical protein QR680_009507 [Steinernema hermaphroditum]
MVKPSKHYDFVPEKINDKYVEALPGIGAAHEGRLTGNSLKCPRCTEDLDLEIEVDVAHGYRVQKTEAATQSESPVQQQPLQRTLDHEPTGSYSYTEKDLKVYMYELR